MTPQARLSPRAWAELLLLSVIWGASFLAVRIALDEVPVLTSVAHRVGWAALILWAVVAARGTPLPRAPRVWAGFLGMGLLNNVLPFTLMAWGQLHIETGLTSILNATTAVMAVLVAAAVFPDERLTVRRLLGVCLGFLGVSIAIGIEAFANFDVRSLAQVAVLAGALSYACAGAWGRSMLRGIDPLLSAAGMLTASSLMILPAALIVDGPPSLDLSLRTWAAIAYYAAISTGFAYLLYYRVLDMAGAGNLLLCTLLVAPVAIILGAVVLGETLAPKAFLGFALLALGLLVLDGRILRTGHRAARKRRRTTKSAG